MTDTGLQATSRSITDSPASTRTASTGASVRGCSHSTIQAVTMPTGDTSSENGGDRGDQAVPPHHDVCRVGLDELRRTSRPPRRQHGASRQHPVCVRPKPLIKLDSPTDMRAQPAILGKVLDRRHGLDRRFHAAPPAGSPSSTPLQGDHDGVAC